MNSIFCTLFDSRYLDKGLTLYQSMENHIDDFKLYVFAFDDTCYDVLKKENYSNMIVVSLQEFETPELLKVKKERTAAEYCWTCSSWIIKHVLEKFNEPICTYIDADMAFFSTPEPVFEKLRDTGRSVIITPHRFRNEREEKKAHDRVGSYCVEFNTFVNDDNGKKALDWWAGSCLEWCYYAVPGTTEWYGDQKYLNVFPERFDGVMICDHDGVGMAPWNINLYSFSREDDDMLYMRVRKTGEEFPLVLFHFENVNYLTEHIIHASTRTFDTAVNKRIYEPYIHQLVKNREHLEKNYGLQLSKKRRVVTKNPLMAFYQRSVSPFLRVRHLKDLYRV